MAKQLGKVKFFNSEKGWGFVSPDAGGKDLFVHFTGIISDAPGKKNLEVGQAVEFEVEQDVKGPRAVNVKIIPKR